VVELPSFGILKMVKDEISFQPDPFVKEYYPPVSIDKDSLSHLNDVIVDDEDLNVENESGYEDKPARSFWWLYALILGAIGVGAIVYYYYYQQLD
jgi:hypothetical protein